MKTFSQAGYQKYLKFVLIILVAILILFGLAPSKTINPADNNLTSEVINSVVVLDTYVVTRSGDSYGLHVLVKQGADFIPQQIRFPVSDVSFATIKLTPDPRQFCPFADKQTKDAGIIASLERGDMLSYDSDPIRGSGLANAYPKLVDLIVDVQGELFLVQRINISGECFWAQE